MESGGNANTSVGTRNSLFSMKTSKIGLYVIIALLVSLGGMYFYFSNKMSFLESENADLKEEKKNELKRVRDSIITRNDTLVVHSRRDFDSILRSNVQIKYIPYEKLIYSNRSLDDALDVISKYRYNEGAKKED